MDITIGSVPPAGQSSGGTQRNPDLVEARLLAVRPPRRTKRDGRGGPERRSRSSGSDPRGGRVIVLLVPDAMQLPRDVAHGDYRVLLRFVRR